MTKCKGCALPFEPKRKDSKFCGSSCRQRWADRIGSKRCQAEGCDKGVRARGLCPSHYNRAYHPRSDPTPTPCYGCGVDVIRYTKPGRKTSCSPRCRYFAYYGRWPEQGKELVGPVPRTDKAGGTPRARAIRDGLRGQGKVPALTQRVRFSAGMCGWCGAAFVLDMRTTGMPARYCTIKCTRKAGRARYRLARGQFAIHPAIRAAIYDRDNWKCQLCGEPVDRALPPNDMMSASLDHIECQAWTLVPDHSPGNLRLAHRLCNSMRGNREGNRDPATLPQPLSLLSAGEVARSSDP